MVLNDGYLLLAALLSAAPRIAETIDCYVCTNVTNISECRSTTTCNSTEICFADHVLTGVGLRYSFGCRPETDCKSIVETSSSNGTFSLVGRSILTGPCSECCKPHRCNKQLCQHPYSNRQCSDSTGINCPTVASMVDICSDTEKANTLCRRFCGLCNYVNGQWSTWLQWSNCDVTCGTGSKTRVRQCNEPAPSGGGHNCIGNPTETSKCTKDQCPVHGSWTGWSPWGSCSTTCGIGLKRRDRSCSNPYPSRYGDHCFGDSRDDNVCLSAACTDGDWADWSVWSGCSRSCGDGIKTRSRSCDNPLPSLQGRYCPGDPYQVETCNENACSEIDGSWGTWSTWSKCSATCNTGMRSRLRDCDSPRPSSGGKYCTGTPYDVQQCTVKQCTRKFASFSVQAPTACSGKLWHTNDCHIIFTKVVTNKGNRYSGGSFVSLFTGTYFFEVSLATIGERMDCSLRKNSVNVVKLYHKQHENVHNETLSSTRGVTLHLVKDDVVNVHCTFYYWSYLHLHDTSEFSGFLVSLDP